MKKYMFLFAAFLFSLSLSAQSQFFGSWTGKGVKNGQPMGVKLVMHKNGNFTMAYDLNPNDLSVKASSSASRKINPSSLPKQAREFKSQGTWSYSNGILTFKGTDEELQLKRLQRAPKARKNAFTMEFRRNNKKMVYYNPEPKSLIIFFGNFDGVTAVVINHEEMY